MAGKELMKEFMGQMVEVVKVGMTRQPMVIEVSVPAPKITVRPAEVSVSPQIRVTMPEVEEPVVHVVKLPQEDRLMTVSHSDGTKSTITSKPVNGKE